MSEGVINEWWLNEWINNYLIKWNNESKRHSLNE